MPQFSFKGYCWVVGTTSFRTVDFNLRIERQLALLSEFWILPETAGRSWRDLQLDYYRFMQICGFVKGDAPNPAKDAREKTSGLVDIGLITADRRLTEAGEALLDVAQSGNFSRNNPLQIPADSFIYLKQLLKTSVSVEGETVRPFVMAAYALLRLGYLSDDEFTYLLPLCTNRENTEEVIGKIEALRNGNGSIDGIILARLIAMDNYNAALTYFTSERVTESVITAVGMNRKSGGTGEKAYDKQYYPFYELLRAVVFGRDGDKVLPLYEASGRIKNSKVVGLWRKYLFNTTARRKLERDGLAVLNDIPLLRATSRSEFKRLFFEQMHLFKARATLSDYADLNRRYFKTADTMIFADGKVEFDVLPRCWLYSKVGDLLGIAFAPDYNITADTELASIAPFLVIDELALYANLETLYGKTVTTSEETNRIIDDERYRRFNALIDERFDRDTLIDLFVKFERRDDNAIRQAVTNNADIPTIFEYILGIAWYVISDRNGDVLNYMNLSLEADLLPRTHAQGGNADIEYVYPQTAAYPAHTLLIEVTLVDNSNQRRMEMEPVSRHLGEYILATGDLNAYCLFVSTFLHRNVISDFRNRRTYEYYSDQYKSVVGGLKILPLATAELRTILARGIGYDRLYSLFELAYRSDEPVPTWYRLEVEEKL
jgi:hypothetical protein